MTRVSVPSDGPDCARMRESRVYAGGSIHLLFIQTLTRLHPTP
jgi:hypothetical protein